MLARLIILLLLAFFTEFYIFLRYVRKKCQWRTQVLYFVFTLLCVVLIGLMLKQYYTSESVAAVYQSSMLICAILTMFACKFAFSIVDVWSLLIKKKIIKVFAAGFAALCLFVSAYGVFFGRFNMTPKYITVENETLPKSFEGYKVLQISDWHFVSLHGDEKKVSEWVDMMNAENPDIICFTGDIITVLSDEMLPFMDALKRLKAKDGKYAIFGNHDFGHYHNWAFRETNLKHIAKMDSLIKETGFEVLHNEHRTICKSGDSIAVVGMDEWDLSKIGKKISVDTRILLAHDPDFWNLDIDDSSDYFLTLSGHTHAMQIGLEFGDWETSFAALRFPYWHGLYKRNGKQLIVNRGIGCTVIPIRFGMSPEYIVVTLKK